MSGRIGIIGGSGLYNFSGLSKTSWKTVRTPYGNPSERFLLGECHGREVVFLARHGSDHRYLPTEINYRANLWAMKTLGVERIISVSAVGSLKKKIKPMDFVVVDQFYDATRKGRPDTFFGEGIVAHISFGNPVCPVLSRTLIASARIDPQIQVHSGGVYVGIEGPAFSTKAESNAFRSMHFDVIGMTNITEAKLAREAQMCYSTLAMVTDYDCWFEDRPDTMVNTQMILDALKIGSERAQGVLGKTIEAIDDRRDSCECASALKNALLTPVDRIPGGMKRKLAPIMGNLLS